MAGPVDWEFAKAAGARIVPAGPRVTPDEAAAVVALVHAPRRWRAPSSRWPTLLGCTRRAPPRCRWWSTGRTWISA